MKMKVNLEEEMLYWKSEYCNMKMMMDQSMAIIDNMNNSLTNLQNTIKQLEAQEITCKEEQDKLKSYKTTIDTLIELGIVKYDE